MRRAAVISFRTARLTPLRNIALRNSRGVFQSSNYVLGRRQSSGPSKPTPKTLSASKPTPSMYIRRFSLAFVSGLVGYSAWYTYKAQNTESIAYGNSNSISTTSIQQSKAPSTSLTSSFPQPAETTEAVERKAVIIGADNLYTGAISGNEPITKDTDESGRKVLEMLSPDQVSQKLRRNEESYLIGRGKGVVRYDVVQMPSNDPIEDDHSEKIIELPQALGNATAAQTTSSDWMFWGVFDGHSGWTTSAKLRQVLINFVARELNSTYKAALVNPEDSTPSNDAVEAAIKTGFTRLDNEIVHESVEKVLKAKSKPVAAELLAPALSGSCALLSFYDSNTKLLRVACTGDSRAVLGRRGDSGKWAATPLSVDQTGGNPDEESRMRKLHPGEDHVIRNGRVLGGLEPTRAFGDATYKWTREVSERLKQSFFGRTPSNLLRTPPYVTAEPVVTTTKIQPEKGDFVVMATDGLWEMLTNEEVVGLVGQWIEKQSSDTNGNLASSWAKMFTQQKGLPVEQIKAKQEKGGQKQPIRQQQWGVKGGEKERFVVEDKNVATHLVRNALGGKDTDMVRALLTLPAPYSRRYRDDLTVEVIFFGNSDKSGDVVVNKEASASAKEIKAKL
ncbi:phosphatase 2C-like domain-containing protein [Amylocarpus encephaloides]|uniref:Phosphatase 2C-like domain-containing protein n=1 Tax=Amylocarpus encephaloides TaxID=45428 RepID=A0A9P7Y8Z9_9HELO|nr:phosphatase 2C-like domain-containing protein [Amylocarpus encephaloides]